VQGLHVCAARSDNGEGAVLIVNRNSLAQAVAIEVKGIESAPTCMILDNSRLLEEADVRIQNSIHLPSQSVVLLRYGDSRER
jgi:hypothetical protein